MSVRMKIIPRAPQEEVVEVLVRVDDVRRLLLHDWADVVDAHVELVLRHHARNLAGHEHLIEELEEPLVLDLGVREEEGHLLPLEAGELVDILHVLEEVDLVVRLRDGDLEHLRARDERREPRQALLATPCGCAGDVKWM